MAWSVDPVGPRADAVEHRRPTPSTRRRQAHRRPERWGAPHAVDATRHPPQAQEKEEDEREARRKAREEMEMKAFLEDKDEAFAEAHQRALEWTDDFAVYAEKKCVETLQRVQREAQAHYDKQLLRQSLRLIRLPWAEKRAISLMNRQKMRNLLRLCAGWRKVDRSMPKYWRLRTKLCGNQRVCRVH